MLRSTVSVETPEGIELQLPVAGLVIRSMAWCIDFCLRMFIYVALVSVLGVVVIQSFFDGVDSEQRLAYMAGLGSIVFFLLEWFFTAVPEAMFGTTPGKKLMGLRVVHVDGTPLSWQSAILRNFLRFADFLPLFYFSAVLSMLIDRRSRRLGDLAAGSMVVYHHNSQRPRASDVQSYSGVVPPIQLEASERWAILDFDERCEGLTEQRQIELAELLSGLGVGSGAEAVGTVRAWARWIKSGQEGHERHASAA